MIDITTRRTIRKYTAEDVPADLVNELLKKAERTQTMGNLQLYSVVATRDPANKARLAPLHFNQPMVQNAPVVLTFCADFHRTTEWAQRRKGHPGYDNFLSFLNAASDALLFCQTFCHLAEEAGLGLCYLGTTLYNASGIIDALALPRLVMPIATITLGRPAEEPPLSDRLPLWQYFTRKSISHLQTKVLIAVIGIRNRCPRIRGLLKKIRKRRSRKSLRIAAIPNAITKH